MNLFRKIGKFVRRVVVLHSLTASLSVLSPFISLNLDIRQINFNEDSVEVLFAALDIIYGLKDEIGEIFSSKDEPP